MMTTLRLSFTTFKYASHLLSEIRQCVFDNMNHGLLAEFSVDEVAVALKDMGPIKAPRCDGYPALFFQRFWHIVKDDVQSFALGILNNGNILVFVNITDIVFIPKLASPKNLKNYRPISLCSDPYKIVNKAISNRLQFVIDKCIDSVQCAFVPRRLIIDNVILAY